MDAGSTFMSQREPHDRARRVVHRHAVHSPIEIGRRAHPNAARDEPRREIVHVRPPAARRVTRDERRPHDRDRQPARARFAHQRLGHALALRVAEPETVDCRRTRRRSRPRTSARSSNGRRSCSRRSAGAWASRRRPIATARACRARWRRAGSRSRGPSSRRPPRERSLRSRRRARETRARRVPVLADANRRERRARERRRHRTRGAYAARLRRTRSSPSAAPGRTRQCTVASVSSSNVRNRCAPRKPVAPVKSMRRASRVRGPRSSRGHDVRRQHGVAVALDPSRARERSSAPSPSMNRQSASRFGCSWTARERQLDA